MTNRLFEHPMRLFFTLSALLGVVGAVFIPLNAILWHRLFFLSLLPLCAYSGFLLTALPAWTDYKGNVHLMGKVLVGQLVIVLLILGWNVQWAAGIVALAWLTLLVLSSWILYLDRNQNNFIILLILASLTLCQAIYAYVGNAHFLSIQLHLHMAAAVYISFRISLVLGAEALVDSSLKDPVFIPNRVYKNLAVLFLLLYVVAELWLPAETAGYVALGVGFILLAKLKELHHYELLRKHYMLFYYAIQCFAAVGYLWLGITKITGTLHTPALHLIALCGMLAMILFVFLTAGLRHSGIKELNYPFYSRTAFVCLFIAGILRSCFYDVHIAFYLYLPAFFVVLVFVLYLCDFIPIFRKYAFDKEGE